MRILAAAAVVLHLAAGAALSAPGDETPAELPPDDFGGRQYVDSAGCVFVRAEVGGAVTWAPRLTSSREHICGFPPTFAAAAAPAAADVRPEIRPEVVPVNAQAVAAVARPVPVAAVRKPEPVTRSGAPRGYKPVWKDDRLNPQRGPRTALGDEQMRRVWTDEVPMRLVEP